MFCWGEGEEGVGGYEGQKSLGRSAMESVRVRGRVDGAYRAGLSARRSFANGFRFRLTLRKVSGWAGNTPNQKGFLLGASWGWPYKARYKRPRSTPIGVRSFIMAFKNKQKKKTHNQKVSHMFAHQNSEGFTGIEPLTFDLFSTSDPRANDLVRGRRFLAI